MSTAISSQRATHAEFLEWESAVRANPSKLDNAPKSVKEFWLREFGIAESSKPATPSPVAKPEFGIRLSLGENPSLEEISIFVYQMTTLKDVIPTDDFKVALQTATDSLKAMNASWDDVVALIRKGA